MKKLLTPRVWVALTLMGLALAAVAQTVGPVRGAALVGRPLQLSVAARLEGAEAAGCLKARVFYGETPVDPSEVSTEMQRGALTVRSRAVVNEPYVTLEVRAGCTHVVSRRFVLLTEPAPDEEPVAVAATLRVDTRLAGAGPAPRARAPGAAPETAVALVQQRERRPPLRKATAPAAPGAGAASMRDRLQVEPWPLLEPGAVLRVSTRMSAPAEDAPRRAAAATLWQALNADAEDLRRTFEHVRGLEGELMALRASQARGRAEAAGLREQLARLRGPSSAAWVPWALALLLGAAAAGWAWRRARSPEAAPWQASFLDEAPEAPPQPAPASSVTVLRAGAAQAVAETPPTPPLRGKQAEPAEASLPASRGAALAALVQESEFLESLGLVAEAIAGLEAYLQDAAEQPPVAYCLLLHLQARSADAAGLGATRAEWKRRYGTPPPTAAEVEAPADLEAHPALLARIRLAWAAGASAALDALEAELFARPHQGERLSMCAWRDVLWLHDVAEVVAAGPAQELPDPARWLMPAGADVRSPAAVDVDLGLKPATASVMVQERPAQAAPAAQVDWVVTKVKEKAKRYATYEDLFDAIAASEGKWAHRQH